MARIYLLDVICSYGNGGHRFTQHARLLRDVTTTNCPDELWCRFPYNQTVKISAQNRSERAEPSHVKPQMRRQLYCSKTDCDGYLLAHVGGRIYYALSPGIHRGWSATRTVALSKPFVLFHYLFLHIVYTKSQLGEGNVPRIPSDKMQGFRWQPSLPSSVLWAPQHRCCGGSSLGCTRQLQGPDLHYRDRALTAQPPCCPYPNRHTDRQYTFNTPPRLLYANSVLPL